MGVAYRLLVIHHRDEAEAGGEKAFVLTASAIGACEGIFLSYLTGSYLLR